jgi:hypothetical protein
MSQAHKFASEVTTYTLWQRKRANQGGAALALGNP